MSKAFAPCLGFPQRSGRKPNPAKTSHFASRDRTNKGGYFRAFDHSSCKGCNVKQRRLGSHLLFSFSPKGSHKLVNSPCQEGGCVPKKDVLSILKGQTNHFGVFPFQTNPVKPRASLQVRLPAALHPGNSERLEANHPRVVFL